MARTSGVSISTVHRIWNAFSLAPHRSETFKLSTDPQFVEKVRDIVGLYLDPPERALVLCVDEKRARFRRSTARSHCCPCGLVRSSAPTTTNAMTPRHVALDFVEKLTENSWAR